MSASDLGPIHLTSLSGPDILSTTDLALGHAMLAKAQTLGIGQRLRYP